MKQSIKRSLLSLMLLGAAANIQASAEEEQGGGGAAAFADQETPPVEQMKKLVLDKVKAAMKEILINWPATVDKAVEMVDDTDGSIRTAMNMMFESFPENVELTTDVLELLIDASLNMLMHNSNVNIQALFFNLDRIIVDVIASYTVQTRDILLEKIVEKICERRMFFYFDQLLNAKRISLILRDHSHAINSIPIDEKLAAIIKQSKTQRKIIFKKGKNHGCSNDHRSALITIPKNYLPAAILHEIGHIENDSCLKLNDLKVKFFEIIKQIIRSELSINNKLKLLLITELIMLSFKKKEEYDADSFKLQKATKKQLTEEINALPSRISRKIRSFDDYLEFRRKLSFKSIKSDLRKILPQQLFDILGIKNFLAYLEFFHAVHPSHYSRMVRIQERIAELDAENPLEPCLAQLKAEAETITAVERKFDFAQKSTLEKLFTKITHCRYLQFLAGTKKAPREQLRARL